MLAGRTRSVRRQLVVREPLPHVTYVYGEFTATQHPTSSCPPPGYSS